MTKISAHELYKKIQPFVVDDIANTSSAVGAGGALNAHALNGPFHTGTLDRAQVPWVATDIATAVSNHAADPDAHHARQHDIAAATDHTITGAALSLVGATATDTLGLITPSSAPGAASAVLRSDSSGELILPLLEATTHLTTPLINTDSGDLTLDPAGGTTTVTGNLTVTTKVTSPLIDTSAGNLEISPTGDIILDPVGNDVLPELNYDINLGALSKKYLTLHAAELWVETLVAQETIATIGGRILVGPTTKLTSDLSAVATSIEVEHNSLNNGDRVYMEANGSLEFMAITSAYSGSGPYTYTVTRNLDGSGANQWYAGDAVFNTGQTGNGFIDLYSLYGIPRNGQTATQRAGPTIVGNVRLSSTYNDFRERWAVGSLNGLYDYSTEIYGFAAGDPTAVWVGLDATNGLRMMDSATERLTISPAGLFEINDSTGTAVITMDASGNSYFSGVMTIGASGGIYQGTGSFGTPTTGLKIWRDSSIGRIGGYNSGTIQWYADTDGKLYAGAGAVWMDADGLKFNVETVGGDYIRFMNASNVDGSIAFLRTAGPTPASTDGMVFYNDEGTKFRFTGANTTEFDHGIDITGNITVSGTVDTVDIAAFKSAYDSHNHDSDYVDVTGDTMTGTLNSRGVVPTANDIYNLGSSGNYFLNGYIRNLYTDTIVGTPSYSHTHAATDITSGTLDDARLPTTQAGKVFSSFIELEYDDYRGVRFDRTANANIDSLFDIGVSWNVTGDYIYIGQTTGLQVYDDGTIRKDGNVVWHAGNDGSGSGLDADTLDGVELAGVVQTSRTVTAGNALTGGGALSSNITINHEDTSTQASVNNSGSNVIQDVTLDTYGHVTALASLDLDAVFVPLTRTVTAGNALTGGGALSSNITIDHEDTSTVANSSNSGTTVLQSITFDTYGHVQTIATADMATALDSRYVNVTGDTMTGVLTVPAINDAVISQPSQSSRDMSMVSYFDRNELVYSSLTGTITYTITGAYTSVTSPNDIVDGSGSFTSIAGTDNTTTQIVIHIDRGASVSNYGHTYWQPFIAYRFTFTGITTYYNNIVVEVSNDNATWYKPTGGEWESSDIASEEVAAGMWLGGYARPLVAGNVWRYARFTLTGRVEDSGYASKDKVWIAGVGVRHVSAPFSYKWLDRAGDTMYGDLVVSNAGTSVFDIDVSLGLTTVTGDLEVTDELIVSDNVATDAIIGHAKISDAAASDTATFAHYDYNSASSFALAQYNTGATVVNADTGESVGIAIAGTDTLTINASAVLPKGNMQIALGDYNRKFSSIHVFEILADHLVAQNVMATIGGRIIVSDTLPLDSAFAANTNTFSTYFGGIVAGDFLYMAHVINAVPQVEVLRAHSGPGGVGPYDYSMERDVSASAINTLINPLADTDSTIDVDDNSLAENDVIQLADYDNSKLEIMTISNNGTSITGGYRYTITRGPTKYAFSTSHEVKRLTKAWEEGNAAVNLGGSVGDGYIELTSTSTILNHYGPTISITSRTDADTWNGLKEVIALGNLRSRADYGATDESGLIIAKDTSLTPTSGLQAITADSTNGVRLFSVDLDFYNGSTQRGEITSTGNLKFGSNIASSATTTFDFTSATGTLRVGALGANEPNLWYDGTDLNLRVNVTNVAVLGSAGTFLVGQTGANEPNLYYDGTDLNLRMNTTDVITLAGDGSSYFAGVMTIGTSGEIRQGTGTLGSNYTGLRIWRDTNVGLIGGYNANTLQWYTNTDGKLYAGAGAVVLDDDGITMTAGTGAANKITWYSGSTLYFEMYGYSTGSTYRTILNANSPSVGTPSELYLYAQTSGASDNTHVIVKPGQVLIKESDLIFDNLRDLTMDGGTLYMGGGEIDLQNGDVVGINTLTADSSTIAISGDFDLNANDIYDVGTLAIGAASATGIFSVTGTLGTSSIDSTGAILGFSRASNNYIHATSASGTLIMVANGLAVSGANSSIYCDASQRVGIAGATPTVALDINSNKIRLRTSNTPASASATGATGEICWDSSYIYVCVATNTWERAALSTW